jgi:hypothetical protein
MVKEVCDLKRDFGAYPGGSGLGVVADDETDVHYVCGAPELGDKAIFEVFGLFGVAADYLDLAGLELVDVHVEKGLGATPG